MDANSPRISAGAFGLGSKVSSCGGPPVRNRSTQRFARPKPGKVTAGGEAAARSSDGSINPPTAPSRRKSRRVGPTMLHTPHLPPTGSDTASIPRQIAASTILHHVAKARAGFAEAVETVVTNDVERGFGLGGGDESTDGLPGVRDDPGIAARFDGERVRQEGHAAHAERGAARRLAVTQVEAEIALAQAHVLGERIALGDLHRRAGLVFGAAGGAEVVRAGDQMPAVGGLADLDAQRVEWPSLADAAQPR